MNHLEANFDGLVGPTHNYAGLSFGNVASQSNAAAISNPKAAALQGLAKMKALHDMGMTQGVLAPQQRPDLDVLRRLGFDGNDAQVLDKAYRQAPPILRAAYSASSMWTANAATVSPSADSADGKVHFTPANLVNKFHRSIEPEVTGRILKATFADADRFVHHQHLPEHDQFGDEGAANHTRLCRDYGTPGLQLFVYGRYGFDASKPAPKRYPARQTREASEAVARLHQLGEHNTVYIQQNPDVIDQGVFHNDVIAVGNQNVLFYHEEAFLNTDAALAEIQAKFGDSPLHFIKVSTEQVGLQDAVKSYLFNTQILTLPNGEMTIIAPSECQENPAVFAYLNDLVKQSTPIRQVRYFDVKQSMQNGGGPACLRLRVALSEQEKAAVNPATLMSESKYAELTGWVEKHYRDRLTAEDLRDPQLVVESHQALDDLTRILNLGNLYPFQR
ncbi:N-succinylarginine dihydrolase [Ferrimonas balearica]|uniref:N-succinylarginine dihydrolase n=1 Tax=Ferrimonas balearica TaxID=44012 RepID=UPI001C998229|nr:N-succinylarginine dihydrolase [Ferrimonas balearica]MBY5922214.1 N-succinylarginine dihydrolase [Ferrimonas balearica]MBY5994446.1 N-succinylarginine dihydrolase [Ferrimonas balearica]